MDTGTQQRGRRAQERDRESYNRVVAYRLREARKAQGLTQEEAAELLEPFIGKRWSKATFSAAETSHSAPPERVRIFSIDELVAFSTVFDKPVQWFLTPPSLGEKSTWLIFVVHSDPDLKKDYIVQARSEREALTEARRSALVKMTSPE